jgi:hypothetical protein
MLILQNHTSTQKSTVKNNSATSMLWALRFRKASHTGQNQSYSQNVLHQTCCEFDCASSLIHGNKRPTGCNRMVFIANFLFAQHVLGTIMPIIRSSRVIQIVVACGK